MKPRVALFKKKGIKFYLFLKPKIHARTFT